MNETMYVEDKLKQMIVVDGGVGQGEPLKYRLNTAFESADIARTILDAIECIKTQRDMIEKINQKPENFEHIRENEELRKQIDTLQKKLALQRAQIVNMENESETLKDYRTECAHQREIIETYKFCIKHMNHNLP